ncbi:hypothetical protein [Streptomyces sp. MST-110588]|uniref:hypothetical protein n=1 Tax=Streptomyces sp. MST-110588 TaxID=2833628 RepID=UPI001F5DB121|nr:hypothetical protein [Streptomyces sp. MST-110588]UNO39245.1 hypothetical protein KGS77_05915 [Streptomyces sp. MST-110588]
MTRLTGWLTLLCAYVATVPGLAPASQAMRCAPGFALALTSGAALCQAVGPGGQAAAWTAEVLKAGNGRTVGSRSRGARPM